MKEQIKKVVFAALVAAVSIAAQADQLYWQVSDIKSSSANPATGEGQYLAYLYASYITQSWMKDNSKITTIDTIKEALASSDAKSEANSAIIIDNAFLYNGSTAKLNTGYSSTDNTVSFENINFAQIGDNGGAGSRVDVFAVVLNAATWADATHYMLVTDTDGNAMSKTITGQWGTSGTTTFDFGSQANNSWYAIGTAIPEPTSGLLLVLGAATLALKRRRA